jgi:hypothetical protein
VLWVFAALALVAGVLLFPLAEHTETSFSWTIQPPLTAAFLGASYWAALILIGWSAARGSWAAARAALAPVFVIAVLLLVATLIHLDRFDMDSLAGPFWLVVYCVVPLLLVLVAWRQPREGVWSGPALPPALRALLAVQGVAMLGVGAALFAAPGTRDDLWAWMLTPLTARAVGAFAVGFGVAALLAGIEADRERYRGAALAYLALGLLELLAIAVFGDDLGDSDTRTALYSAFLVTVVLVGAWGVWATRPSAARAASGSS